MECIITESISIEIKDKMSTCGMCNYKSGCSSNIVVIQWEFCGNGDSLPRQPCLLLELQSTSHSLKNQLLQLNCISKLT